MYAFQRRKRQSTSVFWSGKSQGQRRLTGHRWCGHKALDTDQRLSHHRRESSRTAGLGVNSRAAHTTDARVIGFIE